MTPESKLQQVRRELKALFIERDEIVDGALVAVLARQHVLMLGPPGTAKSMLAKELCRRIGGRRYFEWLLTKFTTPEEIFGPVSLPALEEGRYERITAGKLPEAEVVFLDEVFKANSAILNSLLTVLNERRFHQGTKVVDVPLETLVAASNELPEEDELAALYDRFLLRFTVGYIEQDHRFRDLLRLQDEAPASATLLAKDELSALQTAVPRVSLPDAVVTDVIEIRRKLNHEGVVASDRRYRQAMLVLRAAAMLDGRSEVGQRDLRWLQHVLWADPEEQPKVRDVLSEIATGFEEEARELLAQAREIVGYAHRPWNDRDARSRAVLEAHTKLQEIRKRLDAMFAAGSDRGRDTSALREILAEVTALQAQIFTAHH